jgi:hypothetical protein
MQNKDERDDKFAIPKPSYQYLPGAITVLNIRLLSSILTNIPGYELSSMLWSLDLRSLYPYIQS